MEALDQFAGEDDEAQNDDRPRLAKPGQLADGETLTVEMDAEPEVVDTDHDDAIRFDATFVDADHDGDFDGEGPFATGAEVRVLTWSKRLARELRHANRRTDGSLVGKVLEIRASEGEDQYSRTYSVTVGDDE